MHSHDQRPYLFNETRERFCITEEFKSLRIDLGHKPQTWPTFHFLGTPTWQLWCICIRSICGIYGLLTKCEVKMAGYWPSSFFLRVYGPIRSRGLKTRKKRTRPISSHLDRANLVNKGFIKWLRRKLSRGSRRVVPSGQDSSILPARVANHSAGFFLPAHGASHIGLGG